MESEKSWIEKLADVLNIMEQAAKDDETADIKTEQE
jgi:hypothetical protein